MNEWKWMNEWMNGEDWANECFGLAWLTVLRKIMRFLILIQLLIIKLCVSYSKLFWINNKTQLLIINNLILKI
jgi:hypothetical protein